MRSSRKKDTSCLMTIIIFLVFLFIAYLIQELGYIFWIILASIIISFVAYHLIDLSIKNRDYDHLKKERKKIIKLIHLNIEKQMKEQIGYRNRIDCLFLEIKNNQDILNAFNNFVSNIPLCIFIYEDCYKYFECMLLRKNDIGRDTLWSSVNDLTLYNNLFPIKTSSIINKETPNHPNYRVTSIPLILLQNQDSIDNFINDGFSKFTKLMHELISLENDIDYDFILLRFIQTAAPSFISSLSQHIIEINEDIFSDLSLEESTFTFYKKYNQTSIEDPMISCFTFLMIHFENFGPVETIDYFNYLKRRNELIQFIKDKKEEFDYRIFQKNMLRKNNTKKSISIVDIDLMDGFEFENFVAELFSHMGFLTEVTKHSGDFGIDVIAEKDGIKIGIQAKCYSKAVTNKAIQEITAGMKYYNCQKGIVVTNRDFTKSATELAKANSIQLWGRTILEEKISDFC